METKKLSKKELRSQISKAMREAVTGLKLPEPTKKIRKLMDRDAKKLATVYMDIFRREEKKKKKAEKFMNEAVNGSPKAKSASKKNKKEKPAKEGKKISS